jgi:hypothetical protein
MLLDLQLRQAQVQDHDPDNIATPGAAPTARSDADSAIRRAALNQRAGSTALDVISPPSAQSRRPRR